jgi:hypothetical protein
MPLTRHGVTFRDAYLEAAAIANVRRAMLETLELYHPLAPARLRMVNDHKPLHATLEDDAPADGGVLVTFEACPFRLKPPEESDQADNPQDEIEIDNISGAVSEALRLTRGSLIPWTITNRVYASDQLDGPAQLPPVVVEVRAVQVGTKTVRITGAYGDAGNVAIPALTFKRTEYPTLAR